MTSGSAPTGNSPPLSMTMPIPVSWPLSSSPLASTIVPSTRKPSSATTLMSAAQNSSSPKSLTEIRFIESTTASATSAITHCGTTSNVPQKCMYVAIAVTSTIEVIAQFRKYIQPAANAAGSPRNSRA